jgi:hypothetical protein
MVIERSCHCEMQGHFCGAEHRDGLVPVADQDAANFGSTKQFSVIINRLI